MKRYHLTIAGGEALRSAAFDIPLQPGTLMIGIPEWADLAAPEALEAIRAKGAEPEGYAVPAYAAVEITATCRTVGRTGVEMEALCAVSAAALTVYDMCKAVDRGMRITDVRLRHKSGGKSGTYAAE